MITERGRLTVGIQHADKIHKDFELRPQKIGDSVEIMNDPSARENDSYFGVCLMAKQILKLGDIPAEEITPALIMSLTEIDFKVLAEAKGALEKRLLSFRDETKDTAEIHLDPAKTGV